MNPPSYTMSVKQAADEMGMGTKGVLALIDSGELPAARLGAGYIIRRTDVQKLIDKKISLQTSKRIHQIQVDQTKKGRKRNPLPVLF